MSIAEMWDNFIQAVVFVGSVGNIVWLAVTILTALFYRSVYEKLKVSKNHHLVLVWTFGIAAVLAFSAGFIYGDEPGVLPQGLAYILAVLNIIIMALSYVWLVVNLRKLGTFIFTRIKH